MNTAIHPLTQKPEVIRLHLISYGIGERFDSSKFEPIQNRLFVKPLGGLWASPTETKYGWRDWCIEESFRIERLEESFEFWYSGNVLKVDSVADLDRMTWVAVYDIMQYPDFEAMQNSGVDAIWLTERGQSQTRYLPGRNLYGWDCECVLVMNPDGVKVS